MNALHHEFQCAACRQTKIEPVPYYGSGLRCESCRREMIPPPATEQRGLPPAPPMRTPDTSIAPGIGSLLIVLVFIMCVAVGAKMAGGW